MTQLVDNERTKLLAGALDRASTAVFTVGMVTPSASYFFDLQGVRVAMGLSGLHMLARSVLGALR